MSETTPDPLAEALAAAQSLTGILEDVRGDLRSLRDEVKTAREESEARDAALAKSDRRIRHFVIALAVSFCLDILITAGFGYNTVRVNQTQNASHADLISSCRQANVSREQDAAIWETFLGDIAPPKAQTPKVKALLAGIDRRIAIKDTPKDCVAVYATK